MNNAKPNSSHSRAVVVCREPANNGVTAYPVGVQSLAFNPGASSRTQLVITMTLSSNHDVNLKQDGYTILSGVIAPLDCQRMITAVADLMQSGDGDAIAGKGRVVGGRNLMSLWSLWKQIAQHASVKSLVESTLGESAGAVRVLYFDKPPGEGWSLAMHKDRTIAVHQHVYPVAPFAKPTRKAGVPHVEATEDLLGRMLTLRLHLDSMHDDNGPLVVIPGSHNGRSDRPIESIHCEVGDVFVMRPLLSHGSRASNPDTADHRRVVHLELAAETMLPGEYEWSQFEPVFD